MRAAGWIDVDGAGVWFRQRGEGCGKCRNMEKRRRRRRRRIRTGRKVGVWAEVFVVAVNGRLSGAVRCF